MIALDGFYGSARSEGPGFGAGAMAAGSNVLTVTGSGPFSPSCVGDVVRVAVGGTAGAVLDTTIAAYVSPTEVETVAPSPVAANGVDWYCGPDQSAPIQAAINSSTSGLVELSRGTAMLSAPLNIGGHLELVGRGKYASLLVPPMGQSGVSVIVPGQRFSTILRDFGIEYPAINPPSALGAVFVSAAALDHDGFEAEGLLVRRAAVGVACGAASWMSIKRSWIEDSSYAALQFSDTYDGDAGDSEVEGCWFNNFDPSLLNGNITLAIVQYSSSGLKLVGNKINNFYQAYQLNLAPGLDIGDLVFVGNSAESCNFNGPFVPLLFQRQDNVATFKNVVVDGNQFASWNYAAGLAEYGGLIDVVNPGSPSWLSGVIVGANVIAAI